MDHHKDECKELKQAGQLGDDMNVMIGRILRRLDRENGDNDTCKTLDGDLLPFTDLESNYDKLNKVRMKKNLYNFSNNDIFRANKKMLEFSSINFNQFVVAQFQSA